MNIKLSIIIPQYNENEQVIFPLLSSLNNQIGFDWGTVEVLILNDNSDVILSDEFVGQFQSAKPRYERLDENVGLGRCRNAGMERTSGEYVMFCDADDMFFTPLALRQFLEELNGYAPDVLCSGFLEEQLIDGQYKYVRKNFVNADGNPVFEATWVHGKAYRRQYLLDNDIKFHKKFRVHEDTYFNGLAFELANNTRMLKHITYVWKYNPQSLTRINDAEFVYKEECTFLDSVSELLAVLDVKKPSVIPFKITQFITNVYFTLNTPFFRDKGRDYIPVVEKMLAGIYKRYKHYYEKFPKEMFGIVYSDEKQKLLGGIVNEAESFATFMKRLEKLSTFEKFD